ncbi:MAG: cell division protein FtsA [Blastocatellia bacterium AA13]|nr:MAG: cell division protein FtsA [Blastocatellia bacterium AA13]
MAKGQRHIAAIDIGTTEVRTIVGEMTDADRLEVVGIGRQPSRGVRKGVVVNIEATVDAIRQSVEEAELMSGLPIDSAYVGIGGVQLRGMNSRGVIAISRRNREINEEDVFRVIDQARSVSIPTDREIVDVLPQEFTVDGQDGIGNPIGFLGMRLEAAVHVVSSPITARQNVITSVNRAGMIVIDTVVNHVAVAESTLAADEKEFGAAVVDIGSEITSLTIVYRDAIRHTAVFPIGGAHFTNDIAVGVRTPVPEAERIKRTEGCALAGLMGDHERGHVVEVPSVGAKQPRMLSRQLLCEILQPRAEELFTHVYDEIQRAGFDRQILSSVVLVGGGSMMEGMVDVAEQILDLPARCGLPDFVGGLTGEVSSPALAAAVGVMLFGFHKQINLKKIHSLKDGAPRQAGFFKRLFQQR